MNDCADQCTKQCCGTLAKFSQDQSNVVQIDAGRSYQIGSIQVNVLAGRHIEFQWRHILDTMSPLRTIRYAGNLPFLYRANRFFREAGECVVFDITVEEKRILILGSLALDPDVQYPEGSECLGRRKDSAPAQKQKHDQKERHRRGFGGCPFRSSERSILYA